MGIEENFYERFDLVPDETAMVYFIKSLDDTVTKENYNFRKAKVLAKILKQAPIFEETVKDAWDGFRDYALKQYSEWIRKQAENN